MMSTLQDVAFRAGVAPSTVSRALRGLPTVSETTRARIVAIADELGYVISPSASRLASGRTHTVGVVVPSIDRWYFSRVVAGVERVLRANRFDLLLYNLGDDAGREQFFRDLPLRRRVDAVLVIALPLHEREVAELAALRVPVAVLGAFIEPFSGLRVDDLAATHKAIRHLVNLGHRDIGIISGRTDAAARFTAPDERRRGYLEVLDSCGIPYQTQLEAVADFTTDGGERAMSELLSRPRRPTAVFAISDEMAFGAMRALRLCGLRTPEDMSIIGFDGHEMAAPLDLTTIAQPVAEQGVAAAKALLGELSGGGCPAHHLIQLDADLVIRGTTAPPG
jgi:LacI family transcriptional regulator, repressor for deo operon, udp, cdd, tsx, nupC, and nupG